MNKIDKPKVFISYAWTNEDYTDRVIDFSRRLMSDGVDVLLDKFEMHPGNELNNFMELCVKDKTITNVILLLNPTYAEKANGRLGGVGKETQIISEELYNNVDNTKFVPVIFDSESKEISACLPIYLKSINRIDLRETSNYELNYVNLVKHLYGIDQYKKPEIGVKPRWVDEQMDTSSLSYNIKSLRNQNKTLAVPKKLITDSFSDLITNISKDATFNNNELWTEENYFGSYHYMLKFRNDYLEILNQIYDSDYLFDSFVFFFEQLYKLSQEIDNIRNIRGDYLTALAHELFIYTVAILLKNERHEIINKIIYTPYISIKLENNGKLVCFAEYFYACMNSTDQILQTYYHNLEGKDHYSGLAHSWIQNVYQPICTKSEFVGADILLTNLSVIVNKNRVWFALTYPYLEYDEKYTILKKISISIESNRLAQKYFTLFNVSNIEELKISLQKIKEFVDKNDNRFGYTLAVHTIPFITDYADIQKIGTQN